MSRLDAVSYISHGVGKGETAAEPVEVKGAEEEKKAESGKKKSDSALKQFTVNLTEKAEAGHVDPLIGSGPEGDRNIQLPSRRPQHTHYDAGDTDVVKNTNAHGHATQIA